MSVDSFRLDSFRPWNPFQDKVQILRDSLDICRYPTPVSITATSPLSDSSNSAPESTHVHFCESVRHPLPPRPPSEVCLKDSLPQVINTQHQSAVEDQIPCVNPGVEAFDFDDILQLPDLPSSGDQDHPMICHDLGLESQDSLSFESGDSELACITSQRSNVGNAGSFGVARECSDATIDPAILDDDQIQDIEQTPARNETSDVVSTYSPSDKRVRGPSMRPHSQRTTSPRRQRSKVSKVAVVVNNRHMNKTGRSTRANRPVATSFSALRDQFSSLPVEERLQFLSWLFEGALSQCLHMPTRPNSASASKDVEREEGFAVSSADQSSVGDGIVHGKPPCPSRKGLRWSVEEKRLLMQLREEESLSWSEVINKFLQRFPGRSEGSIQVYWSTTLKNQRLS
ncbi:hypothetical protein N7478_011564 [Penicillium angulare]|uniref:uncharacterized protein n=1 Tax=Penicillium angulare TaxID=116970 RepID=UPI0025411C94|nr:uncharacterized protein N7478_011564 [Penicillium angulare]KAJ5263959.1 hypothetical protein N7478_011564 [Penicillium angulare]